MIDGGVGNGWWVGSVAEPAGQCAGVIVTGETVVGGAARSHTTLLGVRCGRCLQSQPWRTHANLLARAVRASCNTREGD